MDTEELALGFCQLSQCAHPSRLLIAHAAAAGLVARNVLLVTELPVCRLIVNSYDRTSAPPDVVLSEAFYNQAVWPVISAITGPICARASTLLTCFELCTRGHNDWPVMAIYHQLGLRRITSELPTMQNQFAFRGGRAAGASSTLRTCHLP